MDGAVKLNDFISFEDYLAVEQDSEQRYEYNNGQLTKIEATTKAHNRIKRNIIRVIETPEFDETSCELYDENVLTELQEKKRYVYPDIVITCEPSDDPLIVKSPTVIFEILSPSTKKYDKTTKFFRYQMLPSLKQCIFVSQDAIEVRSFLRSDNDQWILTTLNRLEQSLEIPALDIEVALSDIYQSIFA